MYSDNTYRAFLLRMADPETEAAIEEGILNGSIDPEYLRQIEEELIDDSLFGRLSEEEKNHFASEFLCTDQRTEKLKFAAALQNYSAQHAPQGRPNSFWQKLKKFSATPWSLPLAGSLACALLLATWLGVRNQSLRHNLAQSMLESHQHQEMIASLLEEQKQLAKAHASSVPPAGMPVSDLNGIPGIRLSSGVSRGLAAVPVLHISRQATMASIVLELPFDPHGTFHEELLNSKDKTIWNQQYSVSNSVTSGGITIIVLPAAMLTTDDYRLRVEAGSHTAESGDLITYVFRVLKD